MIKNIIYPLLFGFVLMVGMQPVHAQKLNMDKEQADQFVYDCLNNHIDSLYELSELKVIPSKLTKTAERSVFILPGGYYQIKTLRSDCYVKKSRGDYQAICDKRYPMETFNNQLLNLAENGHLVQLKHHQYGQKLPMVRTSLKSIFALFLPTMKPYVSVTSVKEDEMEAILVFHHPKLDFIHMLTLKTSISGLLKKGNVIYGDLYTNIPQDNLKSILDK